MAAMDKETLVLGGILLVAGYGFARSLTSCHPLLRPGDTFFLLGDSLAVGLDKTFRRIAQANGYGYDAMVKGGTAAFQWIRPSWGLSERIATAKPKMVLISLGTNDSAPASSQTDAQHKANIEALIALIRKAGSEPYWILPPRLPWPQTYSDIVRTQKVPVFESASVNIPQGPDGIHATGAGYAGWAGMIWQSITCAKDQQLQGSLPPVVRRATAPRVRFMRRA